MNGDSRNKHMFMIFNWLSFFFDCMTALFWVSWHSDQHLFRVPQSRNSYAASSPIALYPYSVGLYKRRL